MMPPDLSEAKLSQSEVTEVYDRLSNAYDLWGGLTESKARRRALELAEITDGLAILEVAVGTGMAFEQIVARNPNGTNVGLDISSGMLARAQERLAERKHADYELRIGSAFDIPYPDGSFDLLFNSYMFDLIRFEDMAQIIAEFKRVLRENGRLILVNMTMAESWLGGVYERIFRISPKMMGGCRGVTMADPLARGGFRVEIREYVEQLAFPSEVILAHKESD
jgi:ubiquinone/menaquinone biosynthesis C-methylase UbiE